ncbi:uncharacterized protein LACBIDRAFT_295999 [Laccaria bicolor S238N-H82]|uniref:Predicted protein n=1 Tax=Laccaria bicolor (strain S238N-H82 / ATCC MYA-4686) TaxID=486041 RepID=B0E1L6_LACBS|nr:uncharacterized protein LACBIDRAFT_295999 [Laccaria bicolor S238N-H82]EDQ99286.1 predicted protein [Laccaria bicolor S238N-H82]|eukprot:XP_001890096.1 predicted protein [Laccaria bicolor S238N-H82]
MPLFAPDIDEGAHAKLKDAQWALNRGLQVPLATQLAASERAADHFWMLRLTSCGPCQAVTSTPGVVRNAYLLSPALSPAFSARLPHNRLNHLIFAPANLTLRLLSGMGYEVWNAIMRTYGTITTQAAGPGGKYAWMNAANAAAANGMPKPKPAPAAPITPSPAAVASASPVTPTTASPATTTAPAAGVPSATGSSWARPYVPTKKADAASTPLEEDTWTLVTIRGAMFVVEKERWHGGGS